ncbi:MAG: translocation/assembly module TamB domain-containing protein [Rhodobacteraceae bacterium]|nr:translocation/assembly module TamB domain-containing protein [Paracoccaceae bacterium]
MARLILAFVLCVLPMLASAQNARLESFLENRLSSEDRVIEIDGFAGALTAQATMDALRVSDADGVWIELTGLQLDWNRGALLSGRLEVQELSAERIELFRLPLPAKGVEAPEAQASGFRIPDLPVAIQIDRLAVDRILVGDPVLGQALEARATLSALLANGALTIDLDAERLDGRRGTAKFAVDYDPEADAFAIDVAVSEPAEGVLARLLDLPGLPSVSLTVQGAGPLDDFGADIQLATDGAERVSGQVTLAANGSGRSFVANISGDIRPLVDEGSRAFFGDDTKVEARGLAADDGAFSVSELLVSAQALTLQGSADLNASGAPERFALSGVLGEGDRISLPGSNVTLLEAELDLSFDASVSDALDFDVVARGVDAQGVVIDTLSLECAGPLTPEARTIFDGRIVAAVAGLEIPGDPGLQEALGSSLALSTNLIAGADGSLELEDLSLEAAHLAATGRASATPTDGRMALNAEVALTAADLAPFSQLAGQSLAGEIRADVALEAELPGGAIAVSLDGSSAGIDIGVEALEPLLTPQSDLAIAVRRDESGTAIERFSLDNPELTARVSGNVDAEDGGLAVTARLRDVGLFNEIVEGPVQLDVTLEDLQGRQALAGQVETEFGMAASVDGTLAGDRPSVAFKGSLAEVGRFVEQLTGTAAFTGTLDLAPEFPLLALDLTANPGIVARIEGTTSGPAQAFSVAAEVSELAEFVAPLPGPATFTARISDLSNGPLIDAVLSATPGIEARIQGRATGAQQGIDLEATLADFGFLVPQLRGPATAQVRIENPTGDLAINADLTATPGITANIAGRPLGNSSRLDFRARLASLATFAPGLNGGANVDGSLTNLTGTPAFDLALATDSGARADARGQVNLPGGAVAIQAAGNLPLAIAQSFAAGRGLGGQASFDVTLNGLPALENLVGTVAVSEGRLFDPDNGITLQPITADVDVANGRAWISAQASLEGRPINIGGTAGLTAPFPVDLTIDAVRLPVRYADVLENRTTLDLALQGAAQRQLRITGSVAIADTEIRIPDTGLGSAPAIPAIRHTGASSDVRRTLDRAGIDISGVAQQAGTGGPNINLDIALTAETPVFVRGRGLDAGFNGGVRVTGTTSNPIPTGELELTRGRLDFLGRRLDLTQGAITVSGALIPTMEIVAQTTVEDITAQIGLSGPMDNPELSLTSSPELPEDEILARVLFGRGIETLSAFQVARLVNSVRKLSGRAGNGVLEDARNSLGVDDLDLRTDADTGEAELAIGATISENLYSEVELGAGGSTTINLNFDLNDNTRLQGSASSEGETGIGIFWERDY